MKHLAFFTSDLGFGPEAFTVVRGLYCLDLSVSFHLQVPESAGFSPDFIVSFLSGTIIPKRLLDLVGPERAWNYHPGTPARPGRDPAHWAVYHGDKLNGATLHQMTPRVDQGPILAVREIAMESAATVRDWQRVAGLMAASLLYETIEALVLEHRTIDTGPLPWPASDRQWAGKPTTREDFRNICRITPNLSASEVLRRQRAFDVRGYDNLVYVTG